MKIFNFKMLTLTSVLFFSTQAMAEAPHFIWDNQDGVMSLENCSVNRIRKHDLRLSQFSGHGNQPTENLRNYNGVLQSHLINSSMVKLSSGREKRQYSPIEVVGINTNTTAKSNRWFSERGDKGYLFNGSMRSLEDFVFELDLNNKDLNKAFAKELVSSSAPDLKLDKKLYLRIAADSSYYGLSCKGTENRKYVVFRAYQKGHSNEPLFLMGVSAEETSLFKSFAAIKKVAAMHYLSDVGNEAPLVEGDIQDNVMVSTLPSKTETVDVENIPLPTKSQKTLVATQSLQKVVCIGSKHLNVRNESLDKILFKAQLGESIKVFQSWDGTEIKRVINGVEHTFHKVTFPNREEKDQNTGYVAASFIKAEDDCPYLVKQKEPALLSSETKITGLNDKHCCDFPTVKKPTHDWTNGMRRFGANRSGGRKHAACDLYRYKNEPIKSVAPGKVISNLYYFYQGTYALEVRHSGGFVVRYGEMTGYKAPGVKVNATVKMGQKIGKMGKVNSNCCRPMLHFELYSGSGRGSLSRKGASGGRFKRRSDLMNPTSYLEKWANGVF